ncbi:MAG TPA: hypothetical protein VN207_02635 [Ktedonobacteraceae bacterium]|nr:hypothetical protein [Ktedonobacteraceae bacterium]
MIIGFLLIATLVLPLTIFVSQEQQQIHAAPPNHGTIGISPGDGFEGPFANMSSSQQQAVINQMKSDGVQWLRLDYYNNDSYDYQFIKDAEDAGINVDVLLEDFSATPAEFSSFGTEAVHTLQPLGVHTYEILNEVNLYTPTITAANYVPILKAAYTAIKNADSSSTVLMSGLGPGPNSQEPYTYLQAMYAAGAQGYFDAANLHPYSFPDMPAPAATADCQNYNAFCYDLPAMYAVMEQNGDGNKKIWLTEFGCPTGTDDNNPASCTDATLAQQITQAFNRANVWEWTGPLFLFSWQDNTENGDFGLYDANGSPKTAALSAFKQAASLSSVVAAPTATATQAPMVTNATNTPLATAVPVFMTPCAHGASHCG